MAGSASNLSAEMTAAPDIQRLSPEEAQNVQKRQEALDEMLSQEGLAKYKLEIMFSHTRGKHGLSNGLVTWWESGTHLNGDGDSKMYLCDNSIPTARNDGRGCMKFIPDTANGLQYVVCPHCQLLWKPEELVGEMYYNLPKQKWADVLHKWYIRLEHRADIYLKYGRMSIRDAQRKEEELGLQGELLNKARGVDQRVAAIYSLKNIIKDTSNGADLRDRILAFLNA